MLNCCILIGRLTADPKFVAKGDKLYCKFSLAVQRNYKNSEGEIESDFIPCVAFNSIAENIYNFLSKGKKVRITGSLQSSDYVNSDGEKVYSLTLIVNEFEMLFPKEKTIEDYEKIFNEGGED